MHSCVCSVLYTFISGFKNAHISLSVCGNLYFCVYLVISLKVDSPVITPVALVISCTSAAITCCCTATHVAQTILFVHLPEEC